jgi:hypothetical protein
LALIEQAAVRVPSDAGQHDQLQQRQAEQQGCENHENDANGLEMKALSNGRD